MTWASLNGQQVLSARVTIPYYGRWVADVAVAIAATTPTSNALTLGDLVLNGYEFRSTDYAGQFLARLAGGAGGWGKQVAPRAYQSPAGIRLSLVLGDVAREVGESVVVDSAADVLFGSYYIREAGPASRVLRQLAGGVWWVAPDGTTHVGARDTSAIASHFDVIKYDGSRGLVEVATETLVDWMPGRTFTAPTLPSSLVVGSVTHTVTNEGASRMAVLVAADQTAASRLTGPIEAFERESEPRRTYHGVYDYVIQTQDTQPHAVPSDPTLGLPNVQAPIQNLNGGTIKPTVGASCAVVFLDGNPTKPRIIGGPADEVDIADADGACIRDGDNVTITGFGPASGKIAYAVTPGRSQSKVLT